MEALPKFVKYLDIIQKIGFEIHTCVFQLYIFVLLTNLIVDKYFI